MSSNERQVLDEGNCGRATDRGEEACEDVRKRQVCLSPPGLLLIKAARLRTETLYKAGVVRRAGTSRAKPFQTTAQVNNELAQRSITRLSWETCHAPTSKACLKGRNATEQSAASVAGVSRGRSTELPRPTETGRTKRRRTRRSHRLTRDEGTPRGKSTCIVQGAMAPSPQVHHPDRELTSWRAPSSQP